MRLDADTLGRPWWVPAGAVLFWALFVGALFDAWSWWVFLGPFLTLAAGYGIVLIYLLLRPRRSR